ncbi:IL-1 receptor-like protein [Deerpox virus W-1170-84]|uniref:Soluble interferon alpha/beta receptor OPG204 n=1 Tax=Deerpox virus (strain W-1170-84) TaxID=305676 RepID=Q08FG5_DPV84|nr:IL-1 receptor-like protein [Deerpox virus W-1170-84]
MFLTILFYIFLQFISHFFCLNCRYRGGDTMPAYAKKGDPMVLLCTGKHMKKSDYKDKTFIDEYNVTWSKTDSLAFVRDSGARTKITPITHNEIGDRSENLWIGNVDHKDEGVYICTISGGQRCEESTIRLTIDSGTFNLQFQSGKDAKLTCYGTAGFRNTFSDYTLTWFYNGDILPNTDRFQLRDGNSTLIIGSAGSEDSGLYLCALGFGFNSNNYNVTKEYKVTII